MRTKEERDEDIRRALLEVGREARRVFGAFLNLVEVSIPLIVVVVAICVAVRQLATLLSW